MIAQNTKHQSFAKRYKATHTLKKPFTPEEQTFKIGNPVYIPKGYKWFRCNVFFLTSTGQIKSDRDHRLHIYSKSFFKPRKEWFEAIE